MAKVLFVYPNMNSALSISPAVGLLSALLKQQGHQVALLHLHDRLDFGFDPMDLEDLCRVEARVLEAEPDLIGVTATSFEYEPMNLLAGFLKGRGCRTPIVLGGAHATFSPQDYLTSSFDSFCVGEGERALLEICRRIDEGCRDEALFASLPSWLAKSEYPSGLPDPIPLLDQLDDLDRLPPMDCDLFNMDAIITARQGWVDVYTARGCPFPCTFCCNHVFQRLYHRSKGCPMGYRQRSVESVIQEIKNLVVKYGTRLKVVSFQEDFLDFDRKWMHRFCESYGSEIRLPFYMCSRPEWINPDMAQSLKIAGCREVSLGIESGNEWIRNHILKKSMPTDAIRQACRYLKESGIRVFANIMLGAPHETYQTLQDTVDLLAQLRPTLIRPSILVPLRGTDLYRYCQEHGLLHSEPSGLRSLFDESVVRFEEFTSLELLRYRYLLGWRVTVAMDGPAAPGYREAIETAEAEPIERWRDPATLRSVMEMDAAASMRNAACGQEHYRFFLGRQEMEDLGHVKRFELWQG